MINIFSELQSFYTELASLREQSDHFKSRYRVFCVYRSSREIDYLEITPRPLVTYVSSSMVAPMTAQLKIEVELDDITVTGIPKTYTPEQLRPSFFIVGGEPVYSNQMKLIGVDGGDECDYIPGTQWDENDNTYDIILRKRKAIY